MEILWLAIVLYSVGLGLVLHFRPSVMFNENGSWKEFGYQRPSGSRHTLFPFWLFAVTWAFVSYAIAASAVWIFPLAAVSAVAASTSYTDDESEVEEEELTPVTRRGRGRPRKTEQTAAKPRPGYYVLDPETRENGLRKYIYYGSEAPEEEAT